MPDTESEKLVVQSADLLERHGSERFADIRIVTFLQKQLPEITGFLRNCAEYENEGQQALVYEEILELSPNRGTGSLSDQLFVSFEHGMVLSQALRIHLMTERVGIAAVVVAGFLTEINAGGFQHTCVSDRAVLAYNDIVWNLKKIFFQKIAAKQLVPQVRSDTKHEKCSKINHVGVYLFLQGGFVVEAGRKGNAAYLFPVRHNCGEVAVDDFGMGFLGSRAHAPVHLGGNPIIAVHEGDILPAAGAEAVLSSRRMTAVGLMKTVNLRIGRGVLVTETCGTVGGSVVHQQHFVIDKFLRQNTVKTTGQIFFCVINRYDDAQKGLDRHDGSSFSVFCFIVSRYEAIGNMPQSL